MNKLATFVLTAAFAAAFTLFGCKEEKAKAPEAVADTVPQAEETEATTQTEETPEALVLKTAKGETLQEKDGVYYLNDKPYTGKAYKDITAAKKEIEYQVSMYGLSKEDFVVEWEMKDGKFHGKHRYDWGTNGEAGSYKNGKKDGEWSSWSESVEESRGTYKDGKKDGKWEYFDGNHEVYRTEIWENDKLIKTEEAPEALKYKTVKIGKQVWMAENLNIDIAGSKCYDNKPENCAKYGRLYDWKTAKTVCPEGWHLPTEAEWDSLVEELGGEIAGNKLRAKNGWNDEAGNGTDESGFAALPGGYSLSNGVFSNVGTGGHWWASTEIDTDNAFHWFMDFDWQSPSKANLYSVRCLQN